MSKRKLFSVGIKDCKVETFTVGGHGGSGKDTSNTGVRVSHEPSGASGRCVDTRSQLKNKQMAFKRMAESKAFQLWIKIKASQERNQKSIGEYLEEAMLPQNLKIESGCSICGNWTTEPMCYECRSQGCE